ncbi:hypothetical protein E2C01_035862 [Portunus trituberculatus]|uniref:Uncharacterized protein n=1 Tax=Portunus trituberculatus TaxID=210409 RepID=A0A5B7F9I1_PORTR|nr:hypothetical protein [Portunus trituberculatus]
MAPVLLDPRHARRGTHTQANLDTNTQHNWPSDFAAVTSLILPMQCGKLITPVKSHHSDPRRTISCTIRYKGRPHVPSGTPERGTDAVPTKHRPPATCST